MQYASNYYTIPEHNSDKEPDVPFTVNTHENATLDDTSTSADVGLSDISLHTTNDKPQQGRFPIQDFDETFSDENTTHSLIDFSKSKAVCRKRVALRNPKGSSTKKSITTSTGKLGPCYRIQLLVGRLPVGTATLHYAGNGSLTKQFMEKNCIGHQAKSLW